MFNLTEKLKYMVFGAVIVTVGYMFGNLNNRIDAQDEPEIVSKLTVLDELTVFGKLTVLDKLSASNIIVSDKIEWLDADEKPRIVIYSNRVQGGIQIFDANGNTPVKLIGDRKGGGMLSISESNPFMGVSIQVNADSSSLKISEPNGNGTIFLNGEGSILLIGEGRKMLSLNP